MRREFGVWAGAPSVRFRPEAVFNSRNMYAVCSFASWRGSAEKLARVHLSTRHTHVCSRTRTGRRRMETGGRCGAERAAGPRRSGHYPDFASNPKLDLPWGSSRNAGERPPPRHRRAGGAGGIHLRAARRVGPAIVRAPARIRRAAERPRLKLPAPVRRGACVIPTAQAYRERART